PWQRWPARNRRETAARAEHRARRAAAGRAPARRVREALLTEREVEQNPWEHWARLTSLPPPAVHVSRICWASRRAPTAARASPRLSHAAVGQVWRIRHQIALATVMRKRIQPANVIAFLRPRCAGASVVCCAPESAGVRTMPGRASRRPRPGRPPRENRPRPPPTTRAIHAGATETRATI